MKVVVLFLSVLLVSCASHTKLQKTEEIEVPEYFDSLAAGENNKKNFNELREKFKLEASKNQLKGNEEVAFFFVDQDNETLQRLKKEGGDADRALMFNLRFCTKSSIVEDAEKCRLKIGNRINREIRDVRVPYLKLLKSIDLYLDISFSTKWRTVSADQAQKIISFVSTYDNSNLSDREFERGYFLISLGRRRKNVDSMIIKLDSELRDSNALNILYKTADLDGALLMDVFRGLLKVDQVSEEINQKKRRVEKKISYFSRKTGVSNKVNFRKEKKCASRNDSFCKKLKKDKYDFFEEDLSLEYIKVSDIEEHLVLGFTSLDCKKIGVEVNAGCEDKKEGVYLQHTEVPEVSFLVESPTDKKIGKSKFFEFKKAFLKDFMAQQSKIHDTFGIRKA